VKQKYFNGVLKLILVVSVSMVSFSVIYYAPAIPPFMKPVVPLRHRWTNDEIVRQIQEKKVDKDFLASFERDPERKVPEENRIIVAPADGRVKVMRDVEGGKRIVIFLSFWDVHVQRVPLGGKVVDVTASRQEGQEDFKCRGCPQSVTLLDTEVGAVTVKQVGNELCTKVQTYPGKGQTVQTGERLGYIFLGSHTIIDMPTAVRTEVKVGDRVLAGETIIARY
jgi:phosphatidylserine decarboxylase